MDSAPFKYAYPRIIIFLQNINFIEKHNNS